MSRILPVLFAALSLSACSETPTVDGKVQDVWGKPIEGATVQMEGAAESVTSGADGSFSFETVEGPLRFVAGKEGYVKNTRKVMPPADPEAEVAEVVLELYPDPGATGFHAVGNAEYETIAQVGLKTVGTELGAYTGLPADAKNISSGAEFLFSSTASKSELSRLNLQLHRLEFKPSATVESVTGEVDVKINLWMATESVPFELTVLPKEHFYLLTPKEALPAGHYAFHTQDMLTSKDPDALAKLPEELQIAYPFEIK